MHQREFCNCLIYVFLPLMILLLINPGDLPATLYAESSPCNDITGEVLNIENDEMFRIAVCDEVMEFKEFSYCYGVQVGDAVIFESIPGNCEVVSFTVLRNNVQCGVICP